MRGGHDGPALVAISQRERVITTATEGPPPPGHVVVRTRLSDVSPGTDRSVLRNAFGWQDAGYPCVPGYQSVGEVIAVGADVAISVGQRVAAFVATRTEPPWSRWGGHSAVSSHAATQVLALPGAISDLDGALLITTQVGVNAAYRITGAIQGLVVVYGDGLIGAAAALAARNRGFDVVVVGHHPERLEPILDGDRLRVVDNTHRAPSAGALGAPVCAVIDTVQRREVQQEYLSWLRRGEGQVIYSGHAGDRDCWADLGALQQEEITVNFIAGWNDPRLALTTRLVVDGLTMASVVGDVVPYRQAPALTDDLISGRWRPLSALIDWR